MKHVTKTKYFLEQVVQGKYLIGVLNETPANHHLKTGITILMLKAVRLKAPIDSMVIPRRATRIPPPEGAMSELQVYYFTGTYPCSSSYTEVGSLTGKRYVSPLYGSMLTTRPYTALPYII